MLEPTKWRNYENKKNCCWAHDIGTASQSSSHIRNTHFMINKVYTVTAATSSTALPGKLYEPEKD
jgi:hypothetical protein